LSSSAERRNCRRSWPEPSLTGEFQASPKTSDGSLSLYGSSSASSSRDGLPFGHHVGVLEARLRPRIGVEHQVLVRPLEIERVGESLPDANVLEQRAPRVDHPGLHAGWPLVRDALALDRGHP
jgi:hypothetical protein